MNLASGMRIMNGVKNKGKVQYIVQYTVVVTYFLLKFSSKSNFLLNLF